MTTISFVPSFSNRVPPNVVSQLENAVTPILSQMEVDESEVDALCREVDSTIAHAKKIFEAADARGGSGLHQRNNPSSSSLSSVDWHHVVEKVHILTSLHFIGYNAIFPNRFLLSDAQFSHL